MRECASCLTREVIVKSGKLEVGANNIRPLIVLKYVRYKQSKLE
jgi:hypothetical protein